MCYSPRVPRQNGALSLPMRNLLRGLALFVVTIVVAVVGYLASGWSLSDSIYMVFITVFGVGYGEVRPISSFGLRMFTIGVISVGCFSIIYLAGSMVQFLTMAQLGQMLGLKRMSREISKLRNHTIICGFGRQGRMIAADLQRAGVPFVILDNTPAHIVEACEMGYLAVGGDATEESTLQEAGVAHATNLATVLPDDAENVFITLSARNLNRTLRIIARGEVPSTENKLLQAGATHVVLPAHIGAERVAHLLLFPDGDGLAQKPDQRRSFEGQLAGLGVSMEEMRAPEGSPLVGITVGELAIRAAGEALLVAIRRRDATMISQPQPDTAIEAGDALVWLLKEGGLSTLRELFHTGTDE